MYNHVRDWYVVNWCYAHDWPAVTRTWIERESSLYYTLKPMWHFRWLSDSEHEQRESSLYYTLKQCGILDDSQTQNMNNTLCNLWHAQDSYNFIMDHRNTYIHTCMHKFKMNMPYLSYCFDMFVYICQMTCLFTFVSAWDSYIFSYTEFKSLQHNF